MVQSDVTGVQKCKVQGGRHADTGDNGKSQTVPVTRRRRERLGRRIAGNGVATKMGLTLGEVPEEHRGVPRRLESVANPFDRLKF